MKIVESIVLALLILYCPSSKMISPKSQLIVNCTGKQPKEYQQFELYFQEWSSFNKPPKCRMALLSDSALISYTKNNRCGLGPDQRMKVNNESYPLGFMVVHIYDVMQHNLGTFQCTQTINAAHGKGVSETYMNSTVEFGLTEAMCHTNCTFSDNFGYITLTLVSSVNKQDYKPDTCLYILLAIIFAVIIALLPANIRCCVERRKKFASKSSYPIASAEGLNRQTHKQTLSQVTPLKGKE